MRVDPSSPNVRSSAGRGRRAFTLIELLVVIGIIVILIGLLIPVAGKIRITGQRTATLADINRISQACEAYYGDYGAYPGLFRDSELIPSSTPPQMLPATTQFIHFTNYPTQLDSATYGAPANSSTVTSSENLMLSLLGGLSTLGGNLTTPPAVLTYDLATVGNGAMSMNMNKPGHSQAYLQVRPEELSTGRTNAASASYLPGQWAATTRFPTGAVTDTPLPEMLDSFARPHPILYIRSFRGAGTSAPSGQMLNVTVPPTANVTYQYDITQLGPYGFPMAATDIPDGTTTGRSFGDNYPADPAGTKWTAGPQSYFVNQEITVANTLQTPLHKDGYLLISAGADGLYGTADDIHN